MIKLYVKYENKPEDNSELTMFKEATHMTLPEIFKEFKLSWPPDQLIVKIGKRRWYELVDLKDV